MKKLIIVILLLVSVTANAQDIHLVKILNKTLRLEKSCGNCDNRLSLPVSIPAHTAFIYLAISINKTGHFNEIGLFSQLQDLIAANPINILGDLKPLISKIHVGESEGTINFYVATEGRDEGPNMFDKEKGYVCDYSKCKLDFPGGAAGFQVIQNEDRLIYYFGFDNPSEKEASWFHIEAVAVTRDY